MFLSASSRKKTPLMKYVKRTPALAANCRVAFQNSTSFEPSNASSTNWGGVGTLAMNHLPGSEFHRTLPLRHAQHGERGKRARWFPDGGARHRAAFLSLQLPPKVVIIFDPMTHATQF